MPLKTLRPESNKDDTVLWLREFEREYGYEEVALKWTKGNFKALCELEKEELKQKFGEEEGSLIYKELKGKKKKIIAQFFYFTFKDSYIIVKHHW